MKEAILAKMAELRQVGAEDAALAFAAERSMEMVQAYCNLEEMPAELEHVCCLLYTSCFRIHDRILTDLADRLEKEGFFLQRM